MTSPDNLLSRQDWIVTHQPTAPELERVTRELIDRHEQWDTPHYFLTYYRLPDGSLRGAHVAAIDTHIGPPEYPRVLGTLLAEQLAKRYIEHPDAPPIVALALQYEAYGIITSAADGLTAAQEHARLTRTFHQLPERIETCGVITADVGGRVWWAQQCRGDTAVDCHKWEPAAVNTPDGQLVRMMRHFTAGIPDFYLEMGPVVPDMFRRRP